MYNNVYYSDYSEYNRYISDHCGADPDCIDYFSPIRPEGYRIQ